MGSLSGVAPTQYSPARSGNGGTRAATEQQASYRRGVQYERLGFSGCWCGVGPASVATP